jgi:putative toxin-antitoxin system antitoxin component (TIGR02293 family)
LAELIREGLPYASLESVMDEIELNGAEACASIAMSARTIARRKKEQKLRADESDRVYRLARIASLAEEVLGNREKAVTWLHKPNRALGHEAPLRLLDTDIGARQVEALLRRIEHGVYS